MVSKQSLKNIASILEIYIIFWIYAYIILKIFAKKQIELANIKLKLGKYDPFVIIGKLLSINSPIEMLNGFLGNRAKILFEPINKLFYFIFGVFKDIFKYFSNSINLIRNLTRPIRMFFKNAAKMFYEKLQQFMIGITYALHKMRNAIRRSVSGFNMAFHTLNHIQYSFESIYNSPIPGIAEKFAGVLDFLSKTGKTLGLCFAPETLIETVDGNISIEDIKIGQELTKNNFVIAKHQFLSNKNMFNYKGIIVSGSHLVYENNSWIRVEDSEHSFKIVYSDNFIYCLSTTKGFIRINEITFKDFAESNNKILNQIINQITLDKLNKNKKFVNYQKPEYLEHGLGENSMIELDNDKYKKIKELEIGDKTASGYIIGKIQLSPKFLDVYKYKNSILTANVKVNEDGFWLNVADSIFSYKLDNYSDKLYHIITTSEKISVDGIEICDYLENHDSDTNNLIDNLVSKYYNLNIS